MAAAQSAGCRLDYFAVWYVLALVAYLMIGIETRGRTIEELDAALGRGSWISTSSALTIDLIAVRPKADVIQLVNPAGNRGSRGKSLPLSAGCPSTSGQAEPNGRLRRTGAVREARCHWLLSRPCQPWRAPNQRGPSWRLQLLWSNLPSARRQNERRQPMRSFRAADFTASTICG
jgi:hypothetical protein